MPPRLFTQEIRIAWLLSATICTLLPLGISAGEYATISRSQAPPSARWTAAGGHTTFRFDPSLLSAFGMTIRGSQTRLEPGRPTEYRVSISPQSHLEFWAPGAAFDGFIGGRLEHRGNLMIDYPDGTISLRNFTLEPATASTLRLINAQGKTLFYLDFIHTMLNPVRAEFTMSGMDIRISDYLAVLLNEPAAEGMVIGQASTSTTMDFPATANTIGSCTTPNWHDGVNFINDVELFVISKTDQ